MRLLFAHDHRFLRRPSGELYTTGCLPAPTWDRYLEHFDELCVLARDDGVLPDGLRLGRADKERVQFDFLPSLSSFRHLFFRSADLERRMDAAVRSADAVVARLPSEIGHLAVRHAKRLGKPYAVEVVGCAWDGYFNNGAPSARLYAPLAFVRTRRAISEAPLALYVTSKWLQGRYPNSGLQANASNVQLSPMRDAGNRRRDARLEALQNGEAPVLGTIASLQVRSKGVQTALAALGQLRAEGLEFTYRILGSGSAQPWKQLAAKHGVADLVYFDGSRPAGEEVFAWLDEIDIHLQPSFQEGLPRATIEAMNRGVACIGSTCGGIPELLPPERVHRPGDVAGFADRVRTLATNASAMAAASQRDREAAREYHLDTLSCRRSGFYSELRRLAEKQKTDS